VLVDGSNEDLKAVLSVTVPWLMVDGLRDMLGAIADTWYGQPSLALTVIAITGTNGKTSTVQWLARALTHAGQPCGAMGTLGVCLPDGTVLPGSLTTPDVLTTHRLLAVLRDAGAQIVAMEASSIGLEQGRLDGVRLDIAGFTNLSLDHLDYHKTMPAYEAAKARLFAWPGLSRAVINIDDAAGRRLFEALPAKMGISYGLHATAQVRARDLYITTHSQIFTLVTPQGAVQIVTQLLGQHNVSNFLLVAAVLDVLGWPLTNIARALSAAQPVSGRMEFVTSIQAAVTGKTQGSPMVVVDYAHTPDALKRVLEALQPVARARGGRLICLFGCGGERDKSKRPMMGEMAAIYADQIILSNDNPRSEDPDTIVAEIRAGIAVETNVLVQPDRAKAIMQTIWSAATEDVVLLAGKGHEAYQEIAGTRYVFDDREWARVALLLPDATGVSIDTRLLTGGQIFVALPGARCDGHDHLAQAQASGAIAAVVARRVAGVSLPQLLLGDTRQALGRMGAAWRTRFDIPVIGVTGSNGKTTTKEMIATILAEWLGAEQRLATLGNFNNDIGVPLTLLRLRPHHRIAVIELGMNRPGEIAVLAAMAAPTIGLVINAQREHQEFMHSVAAVAQENGAVLAALPEDGYAVYPGDNHYTDVWERLARTPYVLRFGQQAGLDVYAEAVQVDGSGTRCQLITSAGEAELKLPVLGRHNLHNALAACACVLAAGVTLDVVCRALATFKAVAGRLQSYQLHDGTWVVDDTYNANPDSVRAAIDVLIQLPGPRLLVLGDMGEVGINGPALHREMGEYARQSGVEALLTMGAAAREAAAAFGPGAASCESVTEVVTTMRHQSPRVVLVKGSRFMRMERVVKAFIGEDKHLLKTGDSHVT
jgi:murE/murF fusion protein